MGKNFFDQYSLLHFAVGIIAYFWGISFWSWFFLHLLFEIIENSPIGMKFINNNFLKIWPGGKPRPDAFINSLGDQFFACFGWLTAYYFDYMGDKYEWYFTDH